MLRSFLLKDTVAVSTPLLLAQGKKRPRKISRPKKIIIVFLLKVWRQIPEVQRGSTFCNRVDDLRDHFAVHVHSPSVFSSYNSGTSE